MTKSNPKYLSFVKKDRKKFPTEFEKLSTRSKNVLMNNDLKSWDSFYYHLFIKHDVRNFQTFRNSGIKTEQEIITLMRNILDPDGLYNREIEKFKNELNKLSDSAIGILRSIGISLFETFYNRYVIEKEIINLHNVAYCQKKTLLEAEKFVEFFCSYLGVKVPKKKPIIYFDPNNPRIPFIANSKTKKVFSSGYNNLSTTTKAQLTKIDANSIQGFYLAFISHDSQFDQIFKEFGEANLLEIIRFRSILKDTIKKNDN